MAGDSRFFSATIYKVGINPCVDVPREASQFFRKRGYVPVEGRLNGTAIRATLVPVGNGRHRLYINGEMCKQAKVGVGDRIRVTLRLDTQPRAAPMPRELAEALNKNRRAKGAFDRLTPSHQKEILAYLNWLKRPESLERNVAKVIAFLLKSEKSG